MSTSNQPVESSKSVNSEDHMIPTHLPLPARAAAALAISELIPIVATTDTAMVGRILETLSGFISTETSSGLPLSLSLGLGLTVTRLFDEHFLDIAGTQGMVSVWKAVDQLEKTAFGMTEGSVGSMIGVTLCLVSMCREGAAANIAHVRSMQEQLAMALEFATASDSNYQALCQCVASVTASAYASNIVTHQDTDHLVAKLYTAHVTDIQSVSLCAALGTLCHGLMVAGHSTVTDMVDSLITKWMSALTNEEAPTLQRTASLKGLMALTESHPLSQVQGDDSQSRLPLGQLIMSLGRLLQKSCDPVIQSQCATVLGQLYMGGSTSATDLRSAVPNTYHYLGDDSVLRSVVDVLIEAGKLGPEATNICCVEACVKSLVLGGATSQVLPPVNWASIFTPLLRMPFGSEVEKACLQVAVQQSAAVPSAALLLSSWLLPPLYDSLHGSGRVTLLESLLTLVMTVPVQKLTEFFKQGFHQSVMDHSPGVDCDSLNLTALRGLWGALRVHAPPPAITKLLYQTLQETFALWTDASSWNVDERTALCRCLTEVPDEVIDEILQTNFASPNQTASAMFVRCYLVSMGSQPLSWLNASIEASVCNTDMTEGGILRLLMQSFRGSHLGQDKQADVTKRLHWLLELMGYMKGIMVGTVGVSDLHRSADQILEALMLVFAAAVVTWAGSEVSLPLAVTSFGSWDEQEPSSLLAELLPRILPHALHVLLGSQPWAASTGKVIDWLLALHETMIARNSANLLMLIKQCLYNLRHSQAFDKTNTWTVVFSLS
ncbi:Focadhesin [Lamellibrachia satsuma]|nr:Focadhesin [Lamellibrachia satsuma]